MKNSSIRFTFYYSDQGIELKSARRLAKRAPKGIQNPKKQITEKTIGKWVELVNGSGETLYVRSITQLVPEHPEVRTSNADAPLQRVRTQSAKGLFHVILPEVDGCIKVNIYEHRIPSSKGKKQLATSKEDFQAEKVSRFSADLANLDLSDLNQNNKED